MTTHQQTHHRARRGGPFLARREVVVGLAAAVFGMIVSPGAAEGVTITGCLAMVVGATAARFGASWARMVVAAGLGLAAGSVPYWLATAVVIVTTYGF